MNKFVAGKASILALIAALAVSAFLLGKSLTSVSATAAPKVYVCKYVGTPGVNETLQTGQNPIDPSSNALPSGWSVGAYFNDQHGRSYVLAIDVGQTPPTIADCPQTTPPTDFCSNIEGNQSTIPDGYYLSGTECLPKTHVCTDPQATNEDKNFDEVTEVSDPSVCTYEGDICPNLEGTQNSLPEGYHFETVGEERQCIQDTPPPTDVCANIDGVQTSVPSDLHLDAAGQNCVGFSTTNPPENTSTGGQVLGASTMAATGSFTENLYLAIMALGGTLSAFGIKKFAKASR